MKREVKFKKVHVLKIAGVEKRFMPGDKVEIEEKEAIELIRKGVCVPGPQTT